MQFPVKPISTFPVPQILTLKSSVPNWPSAKSEENLSFALNLYVMLTKIELRSLQILDFGFCFLPNNQFIHSNNSSVFILWKYFKASLYHLKCTRKISVYFADFYGKCWWHKEKWISCSRKICRNMSHRISVAENLCTEFSRNNKLKKFLLFPSINNRRINKHFRHKCLIILPWIYDERDTRLHFSQVTTILFSCGLVRTFSDFWNKLNNKWYELMDRRLKNMRNL